MGVPPKFIQYKLSFNYPEFPNKYPKNPPVAAPETDKEDIINLQKKTKDDECLLLQPIIIKIKLSNLRLSVIKKK